MSPLDDPEKTMVTLKMTNESHSFVIHEPKESLEDKLNVAMEQNSNQNNVQLLESLEVGKLKKLLKQKEKEHQNILMEKEKEHLKSLNAIQDEVRRRKEDLESFRIDSYLQLDQAVEDLNILIAEQAQKFAAREEELLTELTEVKANHQEVLEAKNVELKEIMLSNKEKIASLVDNYEVELEELRNSFVEKENYMRETHDCSIRKLKDEKAAAIQTLREESRELKRSLESKIESMKKDHCDQLSTLTKEYDDLLRDVSEYFEDQLHQRKEKAISNIAECSKRYEGNIVRLISTYSEALRTTKSQYENCLSETTEKLKKEIEVKAEQVYDLQSRVQSRENELLSLKNLVKESMEHVLETRKESLWMKSRFNIKNKTIKELRVQLNIARKRLEMVQKAHQKSKIGRSYHFSEIPPDEFWSRHVSTLEQEVSNLQNELKSLKTVKTEKKNKDRNHSMEMTFISDKIENLERIISMHEKDLYETKKKYHDATERASKLSSENQQLQKKVQVLSKQLSSLDPSHPFLSNSQSISPTESLTTSPTSFRKRNARNKSVNRSPSYRN